MGFNYYRNIGFIGKPSPTVNDSGFYNLESNFLYPPLADQIYPLNSFLSSYTNLSTVSTVVNEFETRGYTVIATPTYNAMSERLGGVNTTITSKGVFRYDIFDEINELALSAGYGASVDGFPYIGMSGFAEGQYYGTLLIMYTEYGAGTELKNLWSPNQQRSLNAFLLNPDGSTQVFDAAGSSTIFSDNQQPGTSGYDNTTDFSADDGTWGYSPGLALDGDGGQYLRDASSVAFGCENPNSSDSSANDFYWNTDVIASTDYVFYIFIKKV